eukprot:4744562-Amphidinium_carterae.1
MKQDKAFAQDTGGASIDKCGENAECEGFGGEGTGCLGVNSLDVKDTVKVFHWKECVRLEKPLAIVSDGVSEKVNGCSKTSFEHEFNRHARPVRGMTPQVRKRSCTSNGSSGE